MSEGADQKLRQFLCVRYGADKAERNGSCRDYFKYHLHNNYFYMGIFF
jgi:hypothetical protein